MENKEINLAWIYPDILSLHGDRGNIMSLERIANEFGIKVNVKRIDSYEERIDLENTDILFISPGEFRVTGTVVEALVKQLDEIKEFVEKGKYIIAIGTSGAILANQTIRKNGEVIHGLGILDMECKEEGGIIGDDIYYVTNDEKHQEVVGLQIQVLDTFLKTAEPFATIKYGRGNHGEKDEGARYKNVIFTNALGPVFVKNPWLAEEIIGVNADVEEKDKYSIEKLSFETIKKFILRKANGYKDI